MGIEETKGYIIKQISDAILDIQKRGCPIGQVHEQRLNDHEKMLDTIEKKFWWLITIAFVTLIGISANLAVTFTRLAMR